MSFTSGGTSPQTPQGSLVERLNHRSDLPTPQIVLRQIDRQRHHIQQLDGLHLYPPLTAIG
jgi:hypothetical protein